MSNAPRIPKADDTRWTSTFAGVSIGLLLGFMLGLSATPVVAAVVGALLAAAGVYWSASDHASPTPDGADQLRSLRVRQVATAALCLACIVGVSAGLWLRARDVFALSVQQQVQQWVDAGFKAEDAQAVVALKNAGLLKPGYSFQPQINTPTRSTVLFSASATQCQQLDPSDFEGADSLRAAFANAGARWGRLADAVRQLDPSAQLSVLKASWELACR